MLSKDLPCNIVVSVQGTPRLGGACTIPKVAIVLTARFPLLIGQKLCTWYGKSSSLRIHHYQGDVGRFAIEYSDYHVELLLVVSFQAGPFAPSGHSGGPGPQRAG